MGMGTVQYLHSCWRDIRGGAAMMPFSHMAPGTPMNEFPTQPMVDVNEADYLQQGFTNNMMWDPGVANWIVD
jgi:hypothetical protein